MSKPKNEENFKASPKVLNTSTLEKNNSNMSFEMLIFNELWAWFTFTSWPSFECIIMVPSCFSMESKGIVAKLNGWILMYYHKIF